MPSIKPLAWPFLPSRNISIARAEGVYLYTEAGQPLIDAAGGAIVANVGHGRQRVADAIAHASKAYSYVVPPWLTPSRRAMLDELGNHWLPPYLTRVHCTSGGSEANEAAMKIALHYQQAIGQHQRTQILGRSISYHGTTLATASISGHPGRKKGLQDALPEFPDVATPYPLRCPLGAFHPDAGQYYVDLVAKAIQTIGPDNIAALLAEPIIGSSGGAIVPPDDYWPGVAQLCRENGILLIMDEVMTGFGRTGLPFGFQHWPYEPDILISGKGLAGGYAPLGGVFAKEEIGQAIEQAGYQVMFNTFGAHPAACAAAAEVLKILVEEDLVAKGAAMGEYLHQQLSTRFAEHPHVAEIRGKGLFAAIEVVADRETLAMFPQAQNISAKIVAKGLQKGVFYYGGGTGEVRDIVCMGPPFIIKREQVDEIVDTLHVCVNDVVSAALARGS